MKYYHIATISSLLIALFFSATPSVAQDQTGLLLSKNADFSTEDRSFDPSDVLFIKVNAAHIDYTDLEKNEFRLKPDDGGNDVKRALINNLDGTYTTHVDLSTTDISEDDWEVRVRVEDDHGREFRTRVDINIGDSDFDDDEFEFTGRIDSLHAGGITVDGIFFLVNDSTSVLDDDNQPISLDDLFEGQIVEIRGDRNGAILIATKIKVEDNLPGDNGDDEVEFTGIVDSLDTNSITVTGVTFSVDNNTVVLDDDNNPISLTDLFVGEIVEIRGDRQGDGSLLASTIKVEDNVRGDDEVEFTGNVDAVDGASITVNGITFTIGDNTVFLDHDNNAIDLGTLVPGQLVEIKGFRQADGSILAVRIKIEDRNDDEVELTGEIETIDGSSLVVAGLTFLVDDNTAIRNNDDQPITLADLAVGLIVEIRADMQADGSLLASDIKIEDRLEDEVEVRGLVGSADDSTLVVLGRSFVVVANTEVLDDNNVPVDFSAIVAGAIVEVKANLLPGGTLIALRIELEDNDPLRVSVQGPIDVAGSDTLTVAGIYLLLNTETSVTDQNGNAAMLSDLSAGQTVDVDAQGQNAGPPIATAIQIKKVASVRGAISGLTDNNLIVAGASIAFDANTLVLGSKNEGLSPTALTKGQFVDVYAVQESTGLIAIKIEILGNSAASVGIDKIADLPGQFVLNQNYPNPFNPTTTISFDVSGSQSANISLTIYNILGQSVRTLLTGEVSGGHYDIEWNGKNDTGDQLASGLYLYQLRVNQLVQTKTMVLMK